MFKEQYYLYKVNTHQDPDAFAALYDLYVKEVYRFVFFKVRRQEDAEDITSQVFLKAWQYLTADKVDRGLSSVNFDKSIRNFRAFVYQLARNLVVDFYRQKGRQEVLFSNADEAKLDAVPSSQDLAEETALTQDQQNLLKAVDKLKEEYKEALILRYIQELSIKEVAQAIGKSPLATRVLLHRAIKSLKFEAEVSRSLISG